MGHALQTGSNSLGNDDVNSEDPETLHSFCSYSRSDQTRVQHIADLLRSFGLSIWIDTESIQPAAEWMKEVERAIDAADAFILFLSPHYLKSSVCLEECERAHDDGKRIIPVIISEVPDLRAIPWLEEINWIIATDPSDDAAVAEQILRGCTTDSEWAGEHRQLLLKARDWENGGRRSSRLLRGDDLRQAQLALSARRLPNDPQPAEIQREYLAASVSNQSRRRRLAVVLALAVIGTSSGLGVLARLQANIANSEREVAAAERDRAEQERLTAETQRELADAAREQADEARQVAEEQEEAAISALKTAQRLQAEAEAQVLAFESLRETDPSWASLLAIESMYRSQPPVPSSVEAWLRAAYELNSHVLLPIDIVSWGADTNSFLSPRGDLVYVSNEESAELRTSAGETVHSDLPAGAATWNPSGTSLMVQGASSVFMIAADGTVRQEYPSSTVSFAEWSPDGRWLAGRADDRTVVFYVTESLSLEVAYQAPAGVSRPYFAWYPSGELMAISEKEILGDSPTGIITVVDLLTGESNFGTSPEIAGRIAWESPAYLSSPSLRYSVTDGSVAWMYAERLDGEGLSGYREFGQFSGAPISVLQTPPAGSRNIEPLIAREDGVVQLG
ncbi:MAG: TIR domain-containing protein, partial [Ilumatobacteraceae bacterium]